jgi:hypothetical protein
MKTAVLAFALLGGLLLGCAQEDVERATLPLCDCVANPHACCCTTPIVFDLAGDGVKLTSWKEGVVFDLVPQRGPTWRAWTQAGSDDAWLFRDHTGDGVATDGLELFGDMTEQARPTPGESRNGFRALAEYDDGDGVINAKDSVFGELRLWQDVNHDGVSTIEEVSDLESHGIVELSVVYDEPRYPDPHGNLFRYSAKVETTSASTVAHVAWDVALTSPTRAERVAEGLAEPVPASNEPPPVSEVAAAPAPAALAECTLGFLVGRPTHYDMIPTGTVQGSGQWYIMSGSIADSCPGSGTTALQLWQFHLGSWRKIIEGSYPSNSSSVTRIPKVCRFRHESTWKTWGSFSFPTPWVALSQAGRYSAEQRYPCSNFDTENDPPPSCEEIP